jgi:nitrogen fixation NifU-like protein
MNTQYTPEVMKRFFKPKFAGEIKHADGIGRVGNAVCGDIMEVFLKVDKDRIKDIKFKTMGCVAAIASSDAVCELAKGKTLKEAKRINKNQILKKIGKLPQVKHHCSILGEEALMKAIEDYEKKK